MQLQQGDILIKRSKGDYIYWLSERLLVTICNASENVLHVNRQRYKKHVQKRFQGNEFLPDTGRSWRYAKTRHGFYYCFDNIPDRKPTFFKSKLGTLEDIKRALKTFRSTSKVELKHEIKADIQRIVYQSIDNTVVKYYRFDSQVLFNNDKSKQLAESLAWCRFIKYNYENETFKRLGLRKKKDFLEVCTDILKEKNLEGLKVKNPDYLRQKISAFPEIGELEQRNFLISDKYDNDNARIVGKSQIYDEETGEVFNFDAHEALIHYGYMNPYKSAKQAGAKIYRDFYIPAIKSFGLEPIAERTFIHHAIKLNARIKSARERHGKDYFKKHVQTYIPSKKLKFAHSLFAADGSGTINYKYSIVNKRGQREFKSRKLYVILISDVASRKIVGWAPAPVGQSTETYDMLKRALIMAMKNCDYQTMFEFVSDNHSAYSSKESKELLNLVFNKVRSIEVGNSQANPAEMEFRLFKQSLKSLENFTSSSWDAGLEGHSNADYLNYDNLPTYQDSIIQFHELVKEYNNALLGDKTTPNQRFEFKHPEAIAMDPKVIRLVEGNHTTNTIDKYRGFVQVSKTENRDYRETYLFEIPDYIGAGSELIAKSTGYVRSPEVKVVWTEDVADLYTLCGKFIMSCPRSLKGHKSEAEATESTKSALSHHTKRKAKQEQEIDEFENSLYNAYHSAFGADIMPYNHEMALGSNKESYNESQELLNSESKILNKEERNNRDFDETEDWS